MAVRVVARHFLSLSDAYPIASISVNRSCLIRIRLIKLASNTGVRFQLCQSQNAFHFLP